MTNINKVAYCSRLKFKGTFTNTTTQLRHSPDATIAVAARRSKRKRNDATNYIFKYLTFF